MNGLNAGDLSCLMRNFSKKYYFPRYSRLIFLFSIIVFSFIYDYHDILFRTPQSLHRWRQCDCLSFVSSYYQENNCFFEPSVHNLGGSNTGKAASDFPLLYYIVALLWKFFGKHEFIYRMLVLGFFFSGIFALFRLIENRLKDSVWALIVSLLLFSSPTLVFFANNFLMDIPALSLAFVGLYFFFEYQSKSDSKYIYLFFLAYLVGGLLKISSLLSFVAVFGLFVFEYIRQKSNGIHSFKNPYRLMLCFLCVLGLQFAWYLYAHNYNKLNNDGFFLVGILPIWDIPFDKIMIILDSVRVHIQNDYFSPITQILFVSMFICVLIFFKHLNLTLKYLFSFTFIGFIAYIILFFDPLENHDYYTINLFVFIPIVFLSFLDVLKTRFSGLYNSILVRLAFVLFLFYNVDFAQQQIENRYHPHGWQNKEFIDNLQVMTSIRPYMQSIGIEREDTILSLSDNSINISLYLMNQKGWTNFNINSDSTQVRTKISLGAKYLVLYDTTTITKDWIKPFVNNKIGSYENVEFYLLR